MEEVVLQVHFAKLAQPLSHKRNVLSVRAELVTSKLAC